MNWSSIRPWVGTIARVALGAIWIWAAWAKLGDPRGFVQAVRVYDATPEWLSKAIGYGLPVLEACLGVLLVLGILTRIAAAVSAVLLVVFLVGLIQAAVRGIKMQCACFGGGGTTLGATHYTLDILRDVGLLVVAAFLVLWPLTRLSVDEFLARNDHAEMPSAKRMRTEQGKRKYQAAVEQRRREATVRTRWMTLAFTLVVVLVSVIGMGVQSNRAKVTGDTSATNATITTGVTDGKTTAPVKVDLYEDFQSPASLAFDQSVRTDVAAKVKANQVVVRYLPVAFLDSATGSNDYSSRAADAALCASDISIADFTAYQNVLFGKDSSGKQVQPAAGSSGRTNTQLLDYAKQAKFSTADVSTFQGCMTSETHKALVEAITDNASQHGINATPTVMINGAKLGTLTKASFDAAVKTAAAKAPKPKPTPAASTSAAPSSAAASAPASVPASAAASAPASAASASAAATPSP